MTTDRVGVAHHRLEASRNQLQRGVADGMSHRIVDPLEPIEIEEQDADTRSMPLRQRNGVLDSIEHDCPVRRVRERVALCREGKVSQARDRGIGDALGMQRREDQILVGVPQVDPVNHALLHIDEFFAQLRELRTHAVRLLSEMSERTLGLGVLRSSYMIGCGLRVVPIRHRGRCWDRVPGDAESVDRRAIPRILRASCRS
jgi:hypothetical protein